MGYDAAETDPVRILRQRIRDLEARVRDLNRPTLSRVTPSGNALAQEAYQIALAIQQELGGPTYARLDAYESALQVAEDIFTANLLDTITWWSSGSTWTIPIPGYVAQNTARSYRLEVDVVTEGATLGRWLRVSAMAGAQVLIRAGTPEDSLFQVSANDDTHRYRIAADFNAPANAALTVRLETQSAVTAGRVGCTRPVLTTPIERSA